MLMSSRDIDLYRSVAGEESNETSRSDALVHLTSEEEKAYIRLLAGGDCEGLRIEQERIPFQAVCDVLESGI